SCGQDSSRAATYGKRPSPVIDAAAPITMGVIASPMRTVEIWRKRYKERRTDVSGETPAGRGVGWAKYASSSAPTATDTERRIVQPGADHRPSTIKASGPSRRIGSGTWNRTRRLIWPAAVGSWTYSMTRVRNRLNMDVVTTPLFTRLPSHQPVDTSLK